MRLHTVEEKGQATSESTREPKNRMPAARTWVFRAALVVATMVWGGNFVVAKPLVETFGGFWVIGIRFVCASALMFAFSARHVTRHLDSTSLKAGLVIGIFAFLGFGSQFFGLEGTTPSRNAFLSACYCVTTPFLWWAVSHKRPSRRNCMCALVCVVGMGLVSLQGETGVSWGDGVSILSAILYGGEIVAITLCMGKNDVVTVTVVELLVAGVLGCVSGFFVHGAPSVTSLLDSDAVWRFAYIVILGSCFASTAQNVAQKHLPPAEIGLLCSLESVFGTLFSVVFYNEALTAKMLAGFALILTAIVVSELPARKAPCKGSA